MLIRCTLAEMFLDGTPLFTLSQLLQYKRNEFDPKATLAKIEDVGIRDMIISMISLDPSKRPTAQQLLHQARRSVFPESFYSFVHPFVASLSDPNFASSLPDHHVHLSANPNPLVTDADARIEQMYNDFSRIAETCQLKIKDATSNPSTVFKINESIFPVRLNIPQFKCDCSSFEFTQESSELSLIFSTLVSSVIRNCLFPTSKLKAIDMLLVFGITMRDEFKLDRIVPFFIALLDDPYPNVKINSLVALTQLVIRVN